MGIVLPREENLPKWFLRDIEERKRDGRPFEGCAYGMRVLHNSHCGIMVSGATWFLGFPVEHDFGRNEALRPLWKGSVRIPHVYKKNLFDWSNTMNLVMDLGHSVKVQCHLVEMFVLAFGPDVEFWVSGPSDPVMPRVGSTVVGIVMPVAPFPGEAEAQAERAAFEERAARGVT